MLIQVRSPVLFSWDLCLLYVCCGMRGQDLSCSKQVEPKTWVLVTADTAVFCFPCRERLLPVCRINDFQIADVLNPSKQVHCNPCVSWGGESHWSVCRKRLSFCFPLFSTQQWWFQYNTNKLEKAVLQNSFTSHSFQTRLCLVFVIISLRIEPKSPCGSSCCRQLAGWLQPGSVCRVAVKGWHSFCLKSVLMGGCSLVVFLLGAIFIG